MSIKAKVIGFFLILLCVVTAEAKGWRGIVPLHSTRSQVERILGSPSEHLNSYSVVYKTANETVIIYYAKGRPCGIGEKYSRWRVASNTVIEIFITPIPELPLSQFTINQSGYRKFIRGHLSETQYINAREGVALMVVGDKVRNINHFATADDSHLECPVLPKADLTNCEYLPDPFDSLGDIGFEQEKQRLDNFYLAISDKKAIAHIIAYSGKRARRDEAKRRANRAKRYLISVRHFPVDHIKVIDGGYREKRDLVLYIVSEGACPPSPFPTVDPRDVEIIKP